MADKIRVAQDPQPGRHRGLPACAVEGDAARRRDDATTTSTSPRSASPRPGTRSRRATCRSPGSPSGRRTACAPPAGSRFEFVTISVSDGISMGHEGMHASLVSREIIADSVETVMHAERFDAFVGLAGCDKSLPGMLMAAGRLDLPMVFVYGGTILPGQLGDRALDIVSRVRGGRRARRRARSTTRSWRRSSATPARRRAPAPACSPPTRWRRSAEALGMALPGRRVGAGGRPPARRHRLRERAGGDRLLEQGIRPRQILTKEAFENAIAVVDGARRLDQRRAAPAGDRQRGPGRAHARRLRPHRPAGARTSPT